MGSLAPSYCLQSLLFLAYKPSFSMNNLWILLGLMLYILSKEEEIVDERTFSILVSVSFFQYTKAREKGRFI